MKYTGILFLLALLTGCSSSMKESGSEILISGHVTNIGVGDVLLERFDATSLEVVDTLIVTDDGMFTSNYHPQEPGYYRINLYQTQFVNLILFDEPLTIEVDAKSPMAPYSIKGSEVMDNIKKVENIMTDFRAEVTTLEEDFREAANKKDEAGMEKLREQYIAKQNNINEMIKSEIRAMISSLAVLQAINYLDKDAEFKFVDSVATAINNSMPDYKIKQDFLHQINQLRKVAIGSKAPEIALPDTDGKVIKLSSLNGKYVLLDFWASWCGPCRVENPNLVKAHKRFSTMGFEVFGVSLDRDKDAWLKAIKDDNLNWTQVSDLMYFNSQAALDYNIQGIPAAFLLDPEGNIIAKNLRGNQLEEKLEEIFGG